MALSNNMANASNGKSTSDKIAVFLIVGNVFSWRKVRTFEYVQHINRIN